jgi:DNA-binding PadR family transcriptional regulator
VAEVDEVDEPSLTPTSYLVLGLVGHLGRCTSYEMKGIVAGSIGYFWTFPHSQLYAEPARLVGLGLLQEEQEQGGRKRRTYELTQEGRHALHRWLSEPTEVPTEIRDLAVLKLFFGTQAGPGDVTRVATAAAAGHRARLEEYEAIAAAVPADADRHQLATLALGIRYERASLAYWETLAEEGPDWSALATAPSVGR